MYRLCISRISYTSKGDFVTLSLKKKEKEKETGKAGRWRLTRSGPV